MPRVTAHAVTSCTHHTAHARMQAGCPYVNFGVPEITYGHAIHASQTIFIKINGLAF